MSSSRAAPRAAGGDRVLVVSPYPPARDGIGAYALQQVQALRRAGHHTEVLSPRPSAAHHHRDLIGPRGALALRKLARGFDRVIVQYHQDVFYARPSTPETRRATSLALAAAFRTGPPVTIVLHEVIGGWFDDDDPSAPATKRAFRSAARIEVHVPEHRSLLVDRAGVDPARVHLVDHGAAFVRRTRLDRAAARASLDLPAQGHVFLCIGFVAPHKGFDRAIRAFRGLDAHEASLHVVGSVRVDDPLANEHRRELERLAADVPGSHLHLGFVGDETFDRWIVAADTVVLPYRHIWSSSVVERAALYDRPVIATRVGGLADQLAARPDAVLVADDEALRAALRRAAGAAPEAGGEEAARWVLDGPPTRAAVQAA
ncbi:MAG: hypothetical protein JWN46_917, partial [Acidimicrobiales bacterium]|nr:hypothetical protein [Acidimicrobiales bacterium]